MKARLIPLYFDPGRDAGFDEQLTTLSRLLADRAEMLAPMPLGAGLPEADAVVFPQLLGEAYRCVPQFKAIRLPILIVTSQFGTLSMWDWEIISYLRAEGVDTIAPYDLRQTRRICNALRVKRQLRGAKFLVYQDNPGAGAQASIFKRFYWWEEECTRRIQEQFGVAILKRSFRELGARAQAIPDQAAEEARRAWTLPADGLADKPLNSAIKLYLAVKRDLDEDETIRAVGINCLNESHFSDTTPCLAWNLLYQTKKYIWGCEGDTLSMLTKFMVHHSLEVPVLMTNLYPFLLGNAALRHERIECFPNVPDDPANYVLVAHCGYMGVIPQSFSTEWKLRKKVLAIVNENASAIDARLPAGDITLAKLDSTLREITVAEGSLTGYAQFPGSDCLSGGVIRVRNGRRLMNGLCSHHSILMTGHNQDDLRMIGKVFGVSTREIS